MLIQGLLDAADAGKKPVAALWGPCGAGKTALAWEVINNKQSRSVYHDRPLWVTLGSHSDHTVVISRYQDLIHAIDGSWLKFETPQEAAKKLCSLLKYRKSLIVIDDLCQQDSYLWTHIMSVESCAWLITTQDRRTIRGEIHEGMVIKIAQMEDDESAKMLVNNDPAKIVIAGKALNDLGKRLNNWPLLLKHASLYLSDRIIEGYSLPNAIEIINQRITRRGLAVLNEENYCFSGIESSLMRLDPEDRLLYDDLIVFPESESVSLEVIEKLWKASARKDDFDAEAFCQRCAKCSLLRTVTGKYQMYELFHRYLIETNGARLPSLHDQLLRSFPSYDNWAELPENEDYLWKHLAFHLQGAGLSEKLPTIVKNIRYLAVKTTKYGSEEVLKDLHQARTIAPEDEQLLKLEQCYAGCSQLFQPLMNDRDVKAIFYARMQHLRSTGAPIENWLEQYDEYPVIMFTDDIAPLPFLVPPDGFSTYLVRGQWDYVIGYNEVNKWFFTASSAHVLKVVDGKTGNILQMFEGHEDTVNSCAVSPDGGRVVSVSSDETIRVWDVASGQQLFYSIEHRTSVAACDYSPDGCRIVSADFDGTLIIWDAIDWKAQSVIARRSVYDDLLKITKKDDRLMPHFGCIGQGMPISLTIKLRWLKQIATDGFIAFTDVKGNPIQEETKVLVDGHKKAINDCAFSPDGTMIVSAAGDGTLKLWLAESGKFRGTLYDGGESVSANSCEFSHDGVMIASALSDKTLVIYDCQQQRILHKLEGRKARTDTLSDFKSDVDGHTGEVTDCSFSSDGEMVVSVSEDRTLKVWTVKTGQCLATFYDEGRMDSCLFDGEMIVATGERGAYFLKLIFKKEEG